LEINAFELIMGSANCLLLTNKICNFIWVASDHQSLWSSKNQK